MNDRIIEIENYWARVVRDTAEFQQIAIAENPEFNKMLECVYRVLNEGFINDLTEYGVSRWEKILGLPVVPAATLEERKVQILTYLSIRRPYTIRILKQMLTGLLGEDNFELSIDNDAQTLTIALASTVESMREKIDELCARVIPQNLVIEYDQGLPIDYTPVEFLSTEGNQWAVSPTAGSNDRGARARYSYNTTSSAAGWAFCAFSGGTSDIFGAMRTGVGMTSPWLYGWQGVPGLVVGEEVVTKDKVYEVSLNFKNDMLIRLRTPSGSYQSQLKSPAKQTSEPVHICGIANTPQKLRGNIYFYEETRGSEIVHSMLPALDQTGAPCMYDTVTRTPIYNSGTGDFLYPTDTAPVMTLDLDETFYAKRTEHGIRRLYHVPKGCTMSKDEYAAKNGFKEILEPPMPMEGYWVPEWKETETQLICEWVETEPPTEEGIEND